MTEPAWTEADWSELIALALRYDRTRGRFLTDLVLVAQRATRSTEPSLSAAAKTALRDMLATLRKIYPKKAR
jgi:hypothetical protein